MAGQRETLTLGFRVLLTNIRVVMKFFWASVFILGQNPWPISKLVYIMKIASFPNCFCSFPTI